jgi:glycosyltransferase involved in cell wall biosynthesis
VEENEISIKSNGGTEQTKRMVAAHLPTGLTDDFQIICSRVRKIEEDKIRVYWLHDLPHDPETSHLKNSSSRDRFHKLVFCGHWQYNQYINTLGIPSTEKCAVIDTPIVPIDNAVQKSKEEVRLIYTSTPQRGLALLVPVFIELAKKYPNIKLDVFSSFSIYGWEQADEQYRELFDICKSHPQINYHGVQPNEVVRKHLQRAHIFAYPSIWQECNSRALIEAMSAGCLCIHPNLAGLSDTAGGITSMYQFIDNPNAHANHFYALLDQAIPSVHNESTQRYLRFVKQYTDIRFNINNIAEQWTGLLQTLKMQYPNEESRALPKPTWNYRV